MYQINIATNDRCNLGSFLDEKLGSNIDADAFRSATLSSLEKLLDMLRCTSIYKSSVVEIYGHKFCATGVRDWICLVEIGFLAKKFFASFVSHLFYHKSK